MKCSRTHKPFFAEVICLVYKCPSEHILQLIYQSTNVHATHQNTQADFGQNCLHYNQFFPVSDIQNKQFDGTCLPSHETVYNVLTV